MTKGVSKFRRVRGQEKDDKLVAYQLRSSPKLVAVGDLSKVRKGRKATKNVQTKLLAILVLQA